MSVTESSSTRDRIIGEATRLFAESGIKASTIARIETAVGLRSGSGGVHRYFATKDDLVIAVLETLYARAENKVGDAGFDAAQATELGPFLRSIGEFILRDADDLRELVLIGYREGQSLFERFPQFRQRSFTVMLGPIAKDLSALSTRHGITMDTEAAAFLFVAPLLYHRGLEWLTGETALRLSDERVIDEWVRQQEILLRPSP